jgi:hypothetical protein
MFRTTHIHTAMVVAAKLTRSVESFISGQVLA